MTCLQVRNELDLQFGQTELSPELAEHLRGCASCREYFDELSLLAHHLDGNAPFAPGGHEVSRLMDAIERATEPRQRTTITALRWLRYAAAAAVVTLSVSIGYYQFHKGMPTDQPLPADSTPYVMKDSTVVADSINLSSSDVEQLIYEYTSDASVSSNDSLLENLSDEEIEYLDKNLKVGDLL